MHFDCFFSICQTEVEGELPSEKKLFENFFDQVRLADQLGFGTAWVAETHLSCQVQKQNTRPVIPHFQGEIGLNTDILQLAHRVFSMTEKIHVGSAIRNILCNGGPVAHAESIRTFLTLHGLNPEEKRRLNIGFASGRFPFSNTPYGIRPRNELEELAWGPLKGKLFLQATEIFLRALKGECFSSDEITPIRLNKKDFRDPEDWQQALGRWGELTDTIPVESFWKFEKLGVVPRETSLDLLDLTIGSHDPRSHELANQHFPCGVFNLSITPSDLIEKTHEKMKSLYHPSGGKWKRELMPRTILVFVNQDSKKSPDDQNIEAYQRAKSALENYWKAMEGTLNPERVAQAVHNALIGNPEKIRREIQKRFDPGDRLMLWFDFNNHNNTQIKESMRIFMEEIAPHFR